MDRYDLGHLPPAVIIRGADALAASDRGTTAELVAHIAEIDAQRLYEGLGFESTYAYCQGRLHLSEDAAYKRIQVARVARKYRRLFKDLEEGRLNLSLVCLLAPHLKPDNVDELVAAASHKTNAEVRGWLENRFRPAISVPSPGIRQLKVPLPQLAAKQVQASAPAASAPEPELAPVAEPGPPLEYQMTFTITSEDHERFRYAQALLSHAIPSGDVAAVFRRAIEAVIAECEKRKVAANPRPRTKDRRPAAGRTVPCRGPPCGLEAGCPALHLRDPIGSPLRRAAAPRVRPHRPGRARRTIDRGQLAASLPGAQPGGSARHARCGVHECQAAERSGRSTRTHGVEHAHARATRTVRRRLAAQQVEPERRVGLFVGIGSPHRIASPR